MSVPRLLANIIRSQYNGSDVSDETIPYKGIWLMTKNIMSVNYYTEYVSTYLINHAVLNEVGGSAYPRPHQLLIEWNFRFWGRNLRKNGCEGLDKIKEAYCTAQRSVSIGTRRG